MSSALSQVKNCNKIDLERCLRVVQPPVKIGGKPMLEMEVKGNKLPPRIGMWVEQERETQGMMPTEPEKGNQVPRHEIGKIANNNNLQKKQRSPMESVGVELAIEKALVGDRTAIESLVHLLTPVIQNKVARVLLSTLSAQHIDIRHEVQDMTQDVLTLVFSNQGKLLRSWSPDKGASLPHFIAVVTERRTLNRVKSLGRRTRLFQDSDDADDSAASRASEPEGQAISAQLLTRMTQKIAPQLSKAGEKMFDYIFLQDLSVSEICEKTEMNEDAVYAWRSRLRKKLKTCFEEIEHVNQARSERRGGER